jgi:predicted phosphodiesterase
LLVVVAAVAGGLGALSVYTFERKLSVGEVHLNTDPGHPGALDLYVPLVDWGVRFTDSVRLPARLHVDLRTIDRAAAVRLGEAGSVDVDRVRAEARDAVEGYIRRAVALAFVCALGLGVLVALALRGSWWHIGAAALSALLTAVAIVVLLPPRGDLNKPEYYAHGGDIPRALEAVRGARDSAIVLRDELDAQLVGLARLVAAPAGRQPVDRLPRVTVASDLHNNLLALPTLEGAARGAPLLFAGDLTDRGTPLETSLTRRVVRAGRPFVFVPGNHDSDVLESRLVREGAVVLGTDGRLLADGRRGDVVVRVGSLRIAGYDDPHMRLRADGYADRGTNVIEDQQRSFAFWLEPLVGKADIVMVHDPALLTVALEQLKVDPPAEPLVFVVGHTHRAGVTRLSDTVVVVNGGSIGGGGTGNLDEGGQDVGLVRLTFERDPFTPISADLVEIDPGSGSSRAQRTRLDTSAEG